MVLKQSRRVVTLIRSIQVLHTYSQVRVYMMVVSIVDAPGSLDGVQWVPWSLQHRQSVQDDCLRLVTVMDGKTGDESKRHMHLRSIGTQADGVTKQSRRVVTLMRSIQVLHTYSQVRVYMMVASIVGAPGSLDGLEWLHGLSSIDSREKMIASG